MVPFEKGFWKRLADKRKEAGLTQADLAEKLGITSAGVSRWERADGMPSEKNLEKIAAALATTTEYLLKGDPELDVVGSDAIEDSGVAGIIFEARTQVASRLKLPVEAIRLQMTVDFPTVGVAE